MPPWHQIASVLQLVGMMNWQAHTTFVPNFHAKNPIEYEKSTENGEIQKRKPLSHNYITNQVRGLNGPCFTFFCPTRTLSTLLQTDSRRDHGAHS
jgi:hypothetical protein